MAVDPSFAMDKEGTGYYIAHMCKGKVVSIRRAFDAVVLGKEWLLSIRCHDCGMHGSVRNGMWEAGAVR